MTELREMVALIIDPAGFDDRSDVPGLRHGQALDDRADEALTKADAILNLIGGDGWKPAADGARTKDCAGFVRLIQENPGFWTMDPATKYLSISLDTRDGGHFVLRDRDDNRIEPQRVLAAIDKYQQFLRGELPPPKDTP